MSEKHPKPKPLTLLKESSSPTNQQKITTIQCKCGAQIMLLPDLNAMTEAIERHLAYHQKCNIPNQVGLREFLTEQVLIAAANNQNQQNFS